MPADIAACYFDAQWNADTMGSGMNSSGDIRRCVVLSHEVVFGFSTSYPCGASARVR
jgi:hypothetical protein